MKTGIIKFQINRQDAGMRGKTTSETIEVCEFASSIDVKNYTLFQAEKQKQAGFIGNITYQTPDLKWHFFKKI